MSIKQLVSVKKEKVSNKKDTKDNDNNNNDIFSFFCVLSKVFFLFKW